MDRSLRLGIEAQLTKTVERPIRVIDFHQVGGGCIHRCFRIETDGGAFFLKLNAAQFADHFDAEADGLLALQKCGVRAPRVQCTGSDQDAAYIVLEFLNFGDLPLRGSMHALGASVARMHAHTGAGYGWSRDNYIGATPQHNAACATWLEFWRERRLAPQLAFARRNGHPTLAEPGLQLLDALPKLLGNHQPLPSLLHGDLWSGNASALVDNTPVLFDPAVYYGDPETDLAMTELFGGFTPDFYAGYRSIRPIDPDYAQRKTLYNLYHLLNHLNLFGDAYLPQCTHSISELLAAVKS
ncbi:MAG TPA: fructosamine kinase family protein [Burkholderiales bacterium]|nr:fructosamine kinase family protein [Burkholderiales bacterium]